MLLLYYENRLMTRRHLYCLFTYIYSLLIDKELCESPKLSNKFPCALVYFYLSFGDLYLFFCKFFLFVPIFMIKMDLVNIPH